MENLRVVHELFTCILASQAGRGRERRPSNRCFAEDESLMERYAKDTRAPSPPGFLLYRETSRATDGWTRGRDIPEDFPFNCPFLLIYRFEKRERRRGSRSTCRKSTAPINTGPPFERRIETRSKPDGIIPGAW